MLLRSVLLLAVLGVGMVRSGVMAQDNPVEHMNALSSREEILSKNYLGYMSEVAHGERARKMEKRRQEMINSVRESIRETAKLRPYKGDASLRDAYKRYWTVLLSVLNEDYHKVVDMEEVAEQSYDAMEAYILIQEKASDTISNAYNRIPIAYKAFAEQHGVKLVEGQQSKLERKTGQAANVNRYFNQVYLVFFKSYVQEGLMLKAFNEGDINAVEQAKSSMAKYASEGLLKLDTLRPYQGDGSLITACRKVFEFQKAEAPKVSQMTNFLIKKDDYEKIKKAFDTKPQAKRTQADVDAYNKAGSEYNASVSEYNKLNEDLNRARTKALENWNSTRKRFLDQHVPHK